MSGAPVQVRRGSLSNLGSGTAYPSMQWTTKFGIEKGPCEHQGILMRGCANWRPKTGGSSKVEIAGLTATVFKEPTQLFGWLHQYGFGSTVCSVEIACGWTCFVGRFGTTRFSDQKTF